MNIIARIAKFLLNSIILGTLLIGTLFLLANPSTLFSRTVVSLYSISALLISIYYFGEYIFGPKRKNKEIKGDKTDEILEIFSQSAFEITWQIHFLAQEKSKGETPLLLHHQQDLNFMLHALMMYYSHLRVMKSKGEIKENDPGIAFVKDTCSVFSELYIKHNRKKRSVSFPTRKFTIFLQIFSKNIVNLITSSPLFF